MRMLLNSARTVLSKSQLLIICSRHAAICFIVFGLSSCSYGYYGYDTVVEYYNVASRYQSLPFNKSIAADVPRDAKLEKRDTNKKILFADASGYQTREEADQAALTRCQNMSKYPCHVIVSNGEQVFRGRVYSGDDRQFKDTVHAIDDILASVMQQARKIETEKEEARKQAELKQQQDEQVARQQAIASAFALNGKVILNCFISGQNTSSNPNTQDSGTMKISGPVKLIIKLKSKPSPTSSFDVDTTANPYWLTEDFQTTTITSTEVRGLNVETNEGNTFIDSYSLNLSNGSLNANSRVSFTSGLHGWLSASGTCDTASQ